jgi:hypothetical protein
MRQYGSCHEMKAAEPTGPVVQCPHCKKVIPLRRKQPKMARPPMRPQMAPQGPPMGG